MAESEPTEDGRVIVYYDKRGKVVAVEITDIRPYDFAKIIEEK